MPRLEIALPALVCLTLLGCNKSDAPVPPTAGPPAIVYASHLAAGGNVPPAGLFTNPLAQDTSAARNGGQLFATMNCDGCHGVDGSGWVGPSFLDGRWRYGGEDAEIFMSIYYGRPHGMPAYGGSLGTQGVWSLVTYLKSLPVPEGIATESWENDK